MFYGSIRPVILKWLHYGFVYLALTITRSHSIISHIARIPSGSGGVIPENTAKGVCVGGGGAICEKTE